MSDKSIVFEMYAVHLLLCSPHPLNRAWAAAKNDEVRAVSEAALAKLPLSKEARERALRLMVTLTHHRAFFTGIAETFKFSEYAGNEPHPPEEHTTEIIKRMQALDLACMEKG